MTPSNLTELERRVTGVLQHHAELAMTRTDTETEYVDFLESTVPAVRRRRVAWGIGAAAAVAAVVVALVLAGVSGLSKDAEQNLEPAKTDARSPVEVATDFIDALSVYDVAAASRDVVGLDTMIGLWPGGTPPLQQGMAWAQAAGFRITMQGCSLDRLARGMQVVTCPFAWYFLGSDRLGRPPQGGELAVFVRGGKIYRVSSSIDWKYLGLTHSTPLWVQFERWLEREHPDDVAGLITMDGAGDNGYRAPIWTPGASYDLWAQYVDEWVASHR